MNSDITEQYLEKVYDDLTREQMSLMAEFRNVKDSEEDHLPVLKQRQISQLNNLLTAVLRYRNIKKDLRKKAMLS